VGENGTGKSTLLEAIAVAYGFNPEGGSKNYNFSTYDSHSELHNALRLTKGYKKPAWSYFLRTESFYNVATKEEEYADQVTEMFINNREYFLKRLLEDSQ
jgi:predicted ATPase